MIRLRATDPLTGETGEVLWVKGSGGDLGSATLDGFASLSLDTSGKSTGNVLNVDAGNVTAFPR